MKGKTRYQKPPTPESLAKVALDYLGRYAASEASLRQVLRNRIRRFCLHNQAFAQDKDTQADLFLTIETLIEKHKKAGILNDAAYTEMKIRSLRRAGRSARTIRQKLGHAGISKDLVASGLKAEDDENTDAGPAEIRAAREYARRRKLGPFREHMVDPERARKDLAILARAGFTLETARQVLVSYGGDEGNWVVDGMDRVSAGGWPKE